VQSMAVLLTGMERRAQGPHLRRAGGHTIDQDESTASSMYAEGRARYRRAVEVLPIMQIPGHYGLRKKRGKDANDPAKPDRTPHEKGTCKPWSLQSFRGNRERIFSSLGPLRESPGIPTGLRFGSSEVASLRLAATAVRGLRIS